MSKKHHNKAVNEVCVHNEGKENVLHLVSNTYAKFCIQLSNVFVNWNKTEIKDNINILE